MVTFEELKKSGVSQQHLELLQWVKGLVELSRGHMQNKYSDWDHYDEVYRGIKEPDTQDKKAKQKNAPVKMVVPLGFAQLQTFVAFCMSVYTQKEYFFELVGAAPEDFKAADVGEALLQRDLDHNQFLTKLYQMLIDIGRFGMGVMKCHWEEDVQWLDERVPPKQLNILGLKVSYTSTKTSKRPYIKYQGNKLMNISPYRFFPDPRLPLSRFQEGEFCASEDEYTFADLKKLEVEGVVQGVDFIGGFKDPNTRSRSRFGFVDPMKQDQAFRTNSKPPICVTEIQVKLIPSKFTLDNKPLGEEDFPVKYLIWYANDMRIIRCEPLEYIHDEFTYVVGEMTPDMNHFLNAGLFEAIDEIQDTISWFINSHVKSVRNTIQNAMVVDPVGVNMDDIANHRSVIRLQPGAARSGVERWLKQLDVRDVTGGHVQDALVLKQLLEVITGINDNLLGQFHGGRRSATEARNVTMSAASRLKMYASLIWTSTLERLGRQMLSNLRDGLTAEAYVKMFGTSSSADVFQVFKKITRRDLVGEYDFGVFDGTIPSERGAIADVLVEVLTVLFANPQNIMLTGLDPRLILLEVLRLKGVKYPERFAIQSNLAAGQQLLQQNGQQRNNGGVSSPTSAGTAGVAPAMVTAAGNSLLDGLVRGGGTSGNGNRS